MDFPAKNVLWLPRWQSGSCSRQVLRQSPKRRYGCSLYNIPNSSKHCTLFTSSSMNLNTAIHFHGVLLYCSHCIDVRGAPKQNKSWELGPTGLTPPPSPNVGIFSVNLPEIFGKKRVKYAIKTVIYKSWDWVRHLFYKLP